ncbi:hypothetical protein DACRYDRAFT_105078 [Dacryopinax primogenitus]|uniref:Acid protease n=1 Tax=Dacryopinax primogenitus (strain DJM 731) TaxID=1858805 RepID=M5GCQ9_DACPD|nr:uncharacterized protein DACRYDRAFT_105078 [Dacryopinax primogenitus]EJU04007.1 hypothetical protein DACRYDRAFT_105078 [Dacryopinax primogenitus]
MLAFLLYAAATYAQTTSYVFPFTSDTSIVNGYHIYGSVGSGPTTEFLIDTGSTGVLISPRALGTNYTLLNENFCFAYSSSNNTYQGHWVLAPIVFSGSGSEPVSAQTIPIPVRVATQFCSGATGKCTTDPGEISVSMLGVGLGRGNMSWGGEDGCGNQVPLGVNAFLQLEEMQPGENASPGYIITPRNSSITLGITGANSEGFDFVALQLAGNASNVTYSDWVPPTVEVNVASQTWTPFNASLLIDTGISYSIIQSPASDALPGSTSRGVTTVSNGTSLNLTLPSLGGQELYAFVTGQPGAPAYVSWRHAAAPFVNTGRGALGEFDYLFDARRGRVGFAFNRTV